MAHDPTETIKYTKDKQCTFSIIGTYCVGESSSTLVKTYKTKVLGHEKSYKFGVKIPFRI